MEKNTFEKVTDLIKVPESSRKEKAIALGAKRLETKKETRKVLPEEKYVENLEKIIVRDYFPELPKLKVQSEYLEAVANNDHLKIRELQIRYNTRRRTDRRTSPSARPLSPSVFDPDSPSTSNAAAEIPFANEDGVNEEIPEKKKVSAIDKLTVQTYLDQYTSEDNASFEELAELHHKRERVKNAWMYEAEQRHNESLVYRGPEAITAADEQLLAAREFDANKPVDIDNWTYKARNAVLFNVDEAPLTMAEYIIRAKQNEKVINKEATRFHVEKLQKPTHTLMARVALHQAAANVGHIDITGMEKGVIDRAKLGIIATPSPAPGVNESPLMTWGEIDGTPFRLDAPDITPAFDNAPTFKIPDVPIREKVANDIADQIARRYHGKRKHAMDQIQKMAPKTPTFAEAKCTGKLSLMSPTARRFATDKLGIRVGTDKLIKGSPMSGGRTPSSTRTLYSPALYKMVKKNGSATPKTPHNGVAVKTMQKSSVTDNLLNLPPSPIPQSKTDEAPGELASKKARPSAADFF